MIDNEIIAQIRALGDKYSTSISDVLLKIQEELGEVSGEHLRCLKIKPKKEGLDPEYERLEEACDLLMCVLDLITRLADPEVINDILQKKLDKWASYQKETLS